MALYMQKPTIMPNPRKPAKQKEREGTYRKDRDSGLKLPSASPIQLDTLEGLSEHEQQFMGDIMGFLTEFEVTHHLDKHALLMMADAYRIYRDEKSAMELEGRVIEVVNNRGEVSLKENPRVKIMWGAWDRLFKMMNEFGLTPNARAKLQVVKSEIDEMEEMLSER